MIFLRLASLQVVALFLGLLFVFIRPSAAWAEPTPTAVSGFHAYTSAVEMRLAQQHQAASSFVAPVGSAADRDRLRKGDLVVEQLTPPDKATLPGAMLHHWRATAFVPGARAADFEHLLKDFNAYPRYFSPEVTQAKLLGGDDTHLRAWMRVRQKHVLTVVMDSTYDVSFGQLDPHDGYSSSISTQIFEIDNPGTSTEHPLSAKDEHGFLWRLSTYWTYAERDGGLYLQIESVSLSRAIPPGLGWVLQGFVETVPRESLEFTLRSACNALRK